MTEDYRTAKLDELGRLLHDPNMPIRPAIIWNLLDDIIRSESADLGHGGAQMACQAAAGKNRRSIFAV
jgi:hypothetical protein